MCSTGGPHLALTQTFDSLILSSTFLPGFPPLPRASRSLQVLPASRLLSRPGTSRAHTPLSVMFMSQRESLDTQPSPRLSEQAGSRVRTGSDPCASAGPPLCPASSPTPVIARSSGLPSGSWIREPSGVALTLPAVTPVLPASQALSPRLQSEFIRSRAGEAQGSLLETRDGCPPRRGTA